jgi:uncharacterized membrane protein YfcA
VIWVFLLAVGIVAGIANALVGGGQFLTYPAFVFAGLPAILANTTSSVAVFPGVVAGAFAFRKDLARLAQVIDLKLAMAASLAGGLVGALLLTHTPESAFTAIVPWLLLFGTMVYAFGNQLNAVLRGHMRLGALGFFATQFLIGIYGGYFGAGIGILMLALMGVFGLTDLHAMSGLRTLLSSCINGIAVITFVIEGKVDWPGAIVMAIGGIAGGYAGAAVARRLPPKMLRPVIIVIAVAMTAYFFVR